MEKGYRPQFKALIVPISEFSGFMFVSVGSKSMQEGWGEREGSVSASRHSSWEEEDESSGMWNNAGSQGSSSSFNSGGWGGKKSNKVY